MSPLAVRLVCPCHFSRCQHVDALRLFSDEIGEHLTAWVRGHRNKKKKKRSRSSQHKHDSSWDPWRLWGSATVSPQVLGLSTRPRIVGGRTWLGGDETSDDGFHAFVEGKVVKVHTGGDTVSPKNHHEHHQALRFVGALRTGISPGREHGTPSPSHLLPFAVKKSHIFDFVVQRSGVRQDSFKHLEMLEGKSVGPVLPCEIRHTLWHSWERRRSVCIECYDLTWFTKEVQLCAQVALHFLV